MTQIFEELFLAWCPPCSPDRVPAYLRDGPVRAYGQYTFEQGFQLAAASLAPEFLAKLHWRKGRAQGPPF